ncbi:methionyl-tRNA formyltransferase [Magnetovibrio sp. PR-2]|uniref:methionyl-tRNA formyltransferase n=1 Tax=Magnetovibrio sp. PR-2 TaxID=3120356 RepID=UPI002FCE3402
MRLIFMGTPDFSVPALDALLNAGHDVVCVYSQPPRKAGRGQKLKPTPVHAFAESKGIDVRTPVSLKGEDEQAAFAALEADAAVVVAYGLILPKAILDAPKLGCFNIHASLLPRWRGAAPIQRAIEAGDPESGVTIMQMDEGLDTGDMMMVGKLAIDETTNAQMLHDALSAMGAQLMVETLATLDRIKPTPQPEDGVTYAKKIDKAETRMDWSRPAVELDRQVRALYPLAWFERDGQRVRVGRADVVDGTGAPGSVIGGLSVACGKGALELTHVQPAGKSAMDAGAYLRGKPTQAGELLD